MKAYQVHKGEENKHGHQDYELQATYLNKEKALEHAKKLVEETPLYGDKLIESDWYGNGKYKELTSIADPATGAYVVLSGYVYQFGGTSWSAPVWAGICALINDARVKSGKSRIGFLPPYLYGLLNSQNFRDITSGKNGAYTATTGYDKVTGIGTPNIKNLITYFLSQP